MTETTEIDPLLEAFNQGKVFAYPTEAVFGVGCDPDSEEAVNLLLELKKRPVEKGLILVAKDYSQLLPYVDDSAIPMDRRTEIFSSWPGPVTWLLPASSNAPFWITGGSALIAVRVSAHPVVQSLCARFGRPLVSTSANISGEPPAKNQKEVKMQFADAVICVDGPLGNSAKPTTIKNGLNGQTIRAS